MCKEATAEEEAYFTSDLEVVKAWEQYLDAIRQETYSALAEIAADIAEAKEQGRETAPFLRKRAGVNRFQAALTTRMVFVRTVRSRLEEEEKQRKAEEEEQKRVAKKVAREEAKQKIIGKDTQRIIEAKERKQATKEQRHLAHAGPALS